MTLAIVLDIVVAALLAATIAYAAVLNRRLGTWRRERSELEKLIGAFNEAALQAQVGIAGLKKASEETGAGLQQGLDKGQALRDDLAFLIERGESIADRLASLARPRVVAAAEDPAGVTPEPAPRPAPKAVPAAKVASIPRSAAERELAKALAGRR